MTRPNQSQDVTEWMQAVLESDRDLLAEILAAGMQALMESERDVYVGAGPFERGEARRAQRNGYKPRTQRTRVGVLELRGAADAGRGLLSFGAGALPAE